MFKFLLSLSFLLLIPFATQASDLYYNQPSSDSSTFFGRNSGIYYMGLTFTNNATYDLCQVKLQISRGGSGHSDGVYINLYQTSSNSVPNSGTFIASSNIISASSLPGAYSFATFTFGADICLSIQNGTRYGITVHRSGGVSDSAYYIIYSKYQSAMDIYFASYRTAWVRLDGSSTFLRPAIQTWGNPPFSYDAQDFNISLSADFFPQQYDGNKLLPYSTNTIDYILRPKKTLTDYSVKAIPFLVIQRIGNYDTSLTLMTTTTLPFNSTTQTSDTLVFTDQNRVEPLYLTSKLAPNEKVYYKYNYWIQHETEGAYLVESQTYSIQYVNQSTSTTPLYSTSTLEFNLPNVGAVYDKSNCDDNIITQFKCSLVDALLFVFWPNESTNQQIQNTYLQFQGIQIFEIFNTLKTTLTDTANEITDTNTDIALTFDLPIPNSDEIQIKYLDLGSDQVKTLGDSFRPYLVFSITFFFILYLFKRFKYALRIFLD